VVAPSEGVGAGAGILNFGGTHTHDRIKGNIGFVTENSGTATNTTATTFVFNHGLASTSTGVWASFKTTQIDAWKWTAKTQITITVVNSATSDQIVACYWKAEYVP
jgi:hypothetical protein